MAEMKEWAVPGAEQAGSGGAGAGLGRGGPKPRMTWRVAGRVPGRVLPPQGPCASFWPAGQKRCPLTPGLRWVPPPAHTAQAECPSALTPCRGRPSAEARPGAEAGPALLAELLTRTCPDSEAALATDVVKTLSAEAPTFATVTVVTSATRESSSACPRGPPEAGVCPPGPSLRGLAGTAGPLSGQPRPARGESPTAARGP